MNNRPWGFGPATDAMERHGLRFGLQYDCGDTTRSLLLACITAWTGQRRVVLVFRSYRQAWSNTPPDPVPGAVSVRHAGLRVRRAAVGIELTAWSPFIRTRRGLEHPAAI